MGRAIFLEENVMGKPDQPRPPFFASIPVESPLPKNFTSAERLNRIKENSFLGFETISK